MAQISRSTKVSGGTTLQANTSARAADVETDMLTAFNAHNNHDAGTSSWQVVSASNASSTPLIANNSSGVNNIVEARDNGTAVLTVADGGTTTAKANGGSGKALIANNGTSTGNIFEAQDNGSAVFSVNDGGLVAVAAGGLTLTGSNITFATSGKGLAGTTTNDSAAAGVVGEYIESVVSSATSFPTTGNFGDLTNIALTAGDWDVTLFIYANSNGATVTDFQWGISTTTGNSSSGLVIGSSRGSDVGPTTPADRSGSIPALRVSLTGTTTYYFKYLADYSVATPQARGRLSARRVR